MRASISSMLSVPGMSAMASLTSSAVLLHHVRIPGVGLRGVEPELAPRAALAQQVPALVELGLQRGEPVVFLGTKLTVLQKPVLFIGQPLDLREHGSILVGLGHGLSSGSLHHRSNGPQDQDVVMSIVIQAVQARPSAQREGVTWNRLSGVTGFS